MNNINSYESLLAEEARLEKQINTDYSEIEESISSVLKMDTLFLFIEEKMLAVREEWQTKESVDLKKQLVDFAMDSVVYFLTEKLLKTQPNKKIDINTFLKQMITQYYFQYESEIKNKIENFIDKQGERLWHRFF